ncbi:uncharacterized protein E0L32_003088 [Thyridium curvatum]|uniref:Uncharacterized protein n=1 Tax=Thyridium curvatum TaxID=1093900 RepID=A0A507B2V9_9PEZI|nr:uncharacterized protein E0L32_003088 [Thyridium curvatum]TPX17445.1 hypothetical protein E0L32_003088 [Thyridium curvatum]
MAPLLRARQSLSKERLPSYFASLKSQPYHDPNLSTRPSASGSVTGIRSIAWNPLGSLVATGSADRILRVWNPEKPNVRFSTELKGHQAPIEQVAFNPVKDAELCSVSNDGVVKFWDVRTKACINEVKGLGEAFTLAWAPDGQSLVVGNKNNNVFVLSPTQSTPLSSHQQSVETNQIAFCWSGEKVFVATGDGKVRVLSYPDFEPVLRVPYTTEEGESEEFTLNGHTSTCHSVAVNPTGRYVASGGADSVIALWDTTDWICQRTITSLVGPVKSISFTFDGSYVVGGIAEESGLEISHTESGEHVHSLKTAGVCPVVAWAPTRYCLAYSDAGSLRIIGVDTDRK